MRRHCWILATVATSALLAGCGGYSPTALPAAPSATASSPAAAPATCDNEHPDPTRSYAPQGPLPTPGQMPAGSTMQKIQQRGHLVVGVSADQYLLGFLNPANGNLEGFDIDMAEAIGQAIFGEPGHVTLKVITSADRIPDLQDGTVDLVARNMTINCARWQQIAFSADYYDSSQKILVAKKPGVQGHPLLSGFAALDGLRVCAPAATTSLAQLEAGAPKAIPVVSTDDAECLVDFQNGRADAITTDDTVLAGLVAQDPYAVVADTPKPLSKEPYGIGVNKDQVDLVRFVNGVLEQLHRDGAWQRSYDEWFGAKDRLGPGTQPTPVYGR